MQACLTNTSRYNGSNFTSGYLAAMPHRSQSVAKARGVGRQQLFNRTFQPRLTNLSIVAGSVMLQSMAFGGTLGASLFRNAIAASPFLPQQYGYKDTVPSQSYYAFASAAGCFGPPALPQNNFNNSIFACLVSKDTATLQNASASVSGSSRYATWAFLPVTDGLFIQQLPSQQLLKNQVNGNSILVGVSLHLSAKWLRNFQSG